MAWPGKWNLDAKSTKTAKSRDLNNAANNVVPDNKEAQSVTNSSTETSAASVPRHPKRAASPPQRRRVRQALEPHVSDNAC